ncbi:MAG: 3-ketoacyl-ACP reductase [Planctomycetota bacterium]|jgi:NAD(P)-dependent dehydrogenase (short-subunit alcohol dehydrogenase family)
MSDRPAAIVTGGSRGIGRAIAVQLAELGYDIAIAYCDFGADGKPDDTAANEAKQAVTDAGAKCQLIAADISSADDRARLIEQTRSAFGRCDMLVNNAGVAPSKRLDILEATEASYDRVMGINLKGPYFLTQAVANWMIEQVQTDPARRCRIVNTSSISAYTASPSRGEYCLSKAGVAMMTKLYAARLAEHNIGVFEIRPGIVATDMTAAVTEKYDKLIGEGLTPIRRWGQPEDIAQAVAAIAEGRLDFATGQVLDVDGGFHIQRL